MSGDIPSTSENPASVYCLACHAQRPIVNAVLQDTSFQSRKKGITMVRKSWVGNCGTCGKSVRQFAKAAPTQNSNPIVQE